LRSKKDRHANSLQLVKIFDEVFATKPLAEWRKILDGNGLVFGVVGILDDIPHDKQMIENEVLVPFENDTMLTISSPIWVDGTRRCSRASRRARRALATRSAQRRL
jgi:formyl-CoA transferase